MLRLIILNALLLLTTSSLLAYQNSGVEEKNIRNHVEYLAADELGGRGTNSKGYIKATDYVEAHFKAYKLLPLMKNGGKASYFQDFKLKTHEARNIKSKQDFSSVASRNVLGWIQGTDPTLKEEYIVLSAHLDHVGTIDGRIHNGANDNATGSAAIMELARVIAQKPLKRSVIFALFGAEEIGLVGSKYFVENSPVPLSKVVANLNVDGVGAYVNQPGDQVKLMALGAALPCADLQERLIKVNADTEKLELSTEDPQGYIMRSDQYNFLKNEVPVIMFTDYGNGHYHKPTDDAHRLQYGKLARLANMIYQLCGNLGNGKPLCR
ncbi:MAG: M20/M25/M40 family metallo-hydrolase [Roseivirga sp.]|nr:M20/M25/M40 family metallo-hydrolase [Roseivirga sp.]